MRGWSGQGAKGSSGEPVTTRIAAWHAPLGVGVNGGERRSPRLQLFLPLASGSAGTERRSQILRQFFVICSSWSSNGCLKNPLETDLLVDGAEDRALGGLNLMNTSLRSKSNPR
jgi:hypothetical protein